MNILFFVIPGCRAAANPEAMFQKPVLMDSGLPRSALAPE
jgi:hypothetical protein